MPASRQWQEVSEEVRYLCEALEEIPEDCECGDAESHLAASCRCCHGHAAGGAKSPGQPHCGERIAQLRADLALLCEDFRQAAGRTQRGATGEQGLEVRRDLLLAAGDLGKILTALEDLDRAVVGFRRSCSMADMKRVKRESASLLAHCKKLDVELAQSPFGGAGTKPAGEE